MLLSWTSDWETHNLCHNLSGLRVVVSLAAASVKTTLTGLWGEKLFLWLLIISPHLFLKNVIWLGVGRCTQPGSSTPQTAHSLSAINTSKDLRLGRVDSTHIELRLLTFVFLGHYQFITSLSVVGDYDSALMTEVGPHLPKFVIFLGSLIDARTLFIIAQSGHVIHYAWQLFYSHT